MFGSRRVSLEARGALSVIMSTMKLAAGQICANTLSVTFLSIEKVGGPQQRRGMKGS